MKKLYLSLLFLLSISSCNGQTKTNESKDKIPKFTGHPSPAQLDSLVKAGIDPYFVESQDTVSKYGPKCIVREVLQDKKGYYWLATWHGIMGYDGTVFTNYTLKENLIKFHVVSLYEDKKGNIWFNAARGGVYRYDGKVFKLFTTKDGLPNNSASCRIEDKDGNLWFTTETGVSRYNGKTFTNFTAKDGLCSNNVNAIIEDKIGVLWLGTTEGVNQYDGKSFSNFTDKEGKPFKRVASLFEDKDGNIWIGSGPKEAGGKGLCRYDGKSVTESITPNFVMYICQDTKGNLLLAHNNWPVSTNFILYRYDGKSFTQIIEQTSPPGNPAIFGIIVDTSGNIWFGTARGVCRYDGKTFSYFTE